MNIGSRLDTNTQFIQQLLQDIKQGEIKIPKFQRPFVWTAKQALQLLDSIAQNYPIGSLLLWKTQNKLVAERNIGDFKLPETDDLTPTNYVLDGQQRLTVIYSCLGAPLREPGFGAAYDLEKEEFIEISPVQPKDQQITMFPVLHVFPLRMLFITTELLDFRQALKEHPESRQLQNRLDLLIQVLTAYKIPVVTLKELTIEEVCPIFERINSSGTRLSIYDLMVAATWSEKFDLNDEAKRIALSLESKGFDDISGDTVIKCLSAINSSSVNRNDILKLREMKPQMDVVVTKTKDALLHTVDLLTTEFKIYSWDFLPYEALVVILCSIFAEVKTLSPEQVKRIRQWFWRASFSERYRGASENYISNDIKLVRNFVIDGSGSANTFGEVPSESVLRKAEFGNQSSRSRAFILALANHHPRNLTNGAVLDTTQALSVYNKKQFHHIYPKAFLSRSSLSEENNSLVNICMLAASENNWIRDRNPNQYLPACIRELGINVGTVFASNILPSPEDVNYASLDYATFLALRSSMLHDTIAKLCEGDSP
jgi:hypothetical protein